MARIRNLPAERAGQRRYYTDNKGYFADKGRDYRSRPDWPDRKRRYRLWADFQMTPEEWDALFASQAFSCAICHTTEPNGKGWQTDHDHNLAKGHPHYVRGILCTNCNNGLGRFHDNAEHMDAGATYLRKARARG